MKPLAARSAAAFSPPYFPLFQPNPPPRPIRARRAISFLRPLFLFRPGAGFLPAVPIQPEERPIFGPGEEPPEQAEEFGPVGGVLVGLIEDGSPGQYLFARVLLALTGVLPVLFEADTGIQRLALGEGVE